MDWPAANAPAVLDPRVIFRARDVRAFIAVDIALRDLGLSAPEIYAADTELGLLLLEDLGAEGILPDGAPDPERYVTAVDVLAMLHAEPRPAELPVPGGGVAPPARLHRRGLRGRGGDVPRLVRPASDRRARRPRRCGTSSP